MEDQIEMAVPPVEIHDSFPVSPAEPVFVIGIN